jgi:hypothetical protein
MKILDDTKPWATLMIGLLVVIVAAVGGAVVLFGDEGALSFEAYLSTIKDFAIAVGILGVGRGIVSYGKNVGAAKSLSDTELALSMPANDSWRLEEDWLEDVQPEPARQPTREPIEG